MNAVHVGDRIKVDAECTGKGGETHKIWATVEAKYKRFVVAVTDAGYRKTVWIDGRGKLVQE